MGPQYGYMHNMMNWGGWIGPWGWIVILALVCFLAYALFGRGASGPSSRSEAPFRGERQDSEPPLEILKLRYAKGEISREEFEQMKKDISAG